MQATFLPPRPNILSLSFKYNGSCLAFLYRPLLHDEQRCCIIIWGDRVQNVKIVKIVASQLF